MKNIVPATALAIALATIGSITAMTAEDVTPVETFEAQEVLPLPGALSETPMFNSNNPEVVQTEGILLSTMSAAGKSNPAAHLDHCFDKNFTIFSHHISRMRDVADKRTLYQGIVLHNPGDTDARVRVTSGASYLSQPDAPFIAMPAMVPNPRGKIYAGPGSRIANDVLRGKKPRGRLVKHKVKIKAGESVILAKLPIPAGKFDPPLNGRSTLLNLEIESGQVQVADVAAFGLITSNGKELKPSDAYFLELLARGDLAGPRERAATVPGASGPFAYGRVAGVSRGAAWNSAADPGAVADPSADGSKTYPIAAPGEQFSFVVSALAHGTFGTQQDQAAPLLVRYPESAYRAHGNYGLRYDLLFHLKNTQAEARNIDVLFQTPLKTNKLEHGLKFASPAYKQVFFRGTVGVSYADKRGKMHSKYFHLVQHRGERGEPLARLELPAGETRDVRVEFVYPPDATPPQVITIRTVR